MLANIVIYSIAVVVDAFVRIALREFFLYMFIGSPGRIHLAF